MASVTKADGWQAAGQGIGNLFQAFAQGPMLRQQAQQQAALLEAQTYAQRMTGDKYGAEAEGLGMTNAARTSALEAIRNNPEMPEHERVFNDMFYKSGDTNIDRLASARGSLQSQDYIRQMVANPAMQSNVGGAYAAIKGTTPYTNVGNTGVSLNQYTGQQSTSHPGLFGMFGNKEQAQAQKDFAQAEKDRDSMRYGGTEVFQDGSGGVLLIDRRTGRAAPVTGQGGQPVIGKTDGIANRTAAEAQQAIDVLDQAEALLGSATNSGIGTLYDKAMEMIGSSTDGAKSAAALKVLGGRLVSLMPKMSGPQSDKDVALYREMAAQVGDSTVPADTRRVAMAELRRLMEKYADPQYGSQHIGAAPTATPTPGQSSQQVGGKWDVNSAEFRAHITQKLQAAPGGEASAKAQQAPKANYSIGQHLNMARDALRNGAPRAAVEAMLRQNGIDPAKLGK